MGVYVVASCTSSRAPDAPLGPSVSVWTPADSAVESDATVAFRVNEGTENIGARRLHTIMERVLDEISFDAPDKKGEHVKVDADYVRKMLADIVKDQDLSRYIL